MNITAQKEELLKITNIIQAIITPKITLPILGNFYIKAEKKNVLIQATDLELAVKTGLAANIISDGKITIPAKKFIEIIHELPDNAVVEIKSDESYKIYINCLRSEYKVAGMNPEEFPTIPEFPKENNFLLPISTLKEVFRKTSFATSKDETRYVLSGVLFNVEKKLQPDTPNYTLKVVATDGRRLSYIERDVEITDKSTPLKASAIIPAKCVNEVVRLLPYMEKENVENVKIGITENQIGFSFVVDSKEITTVLSRIISGNFPNYEQVIPKTAESKVKLPKDEFSHITRRAQLCSIERGGQVKYIFEKGLLKIQAAQAGLIEFKEEIDVDYKGQNFEIAFNPEYILDILKVVDSDEVLVEMNSSLQPAVIKPINDEKFLYVVMPMKVS